MSGSRANRSSMAGSDQKLKRTTILRLLGDGISRSLVGRTRGVLPSACLVWFPRVLTWSATSRLPSGTAEHRRDGGRHHLAQLVMRPDHLSGAAVPYFGS